MLQRIENMLQVMKKRFAKVSSEEKGSVGIAVVYVLVMTTFITAIAAYSVQITLNARAVENRQTVNSSLVTVSERTTEVIVGMKSKPASEVKAAVENVANEASPRGTVAVVAKLVSRNDGNWLKVTNTVSVGKISSSVSSTHKLVEADDRVIMGFTVDGKAIWG